MHCYNFGAAIAQFERRKLTMQRVVDLALAAGLTVSCGSNGLSDAMIGAFDEYKRLVEIDEKYRLAKEG